MKNSSTIQHDGMVFETSFGYHCHFPSISSKFQRGLSSRFENLNTVISSSFHYSKTSWNGRSPEKCVDKVKVTGNWLNIHWSGISSELFVCSCWKVRFLVCVAYLYKFRTCDRVGTSITWLSVQLQTWFSPFLSDLNRLAVIETKGRALCTFSRWWHFESTDWSETVETRFSA